MDALLAGCLASYYTDAQADWALVKRGPADAGAFLLARSAQPAKLSHLDPACLGLFGLGQYKRDHAVLHLGTDLALVDLVGHLEAARVVADVVFSIDRLHPLVFGKVDSALDGDNIVLDVGLDAVGPHAWHFKHDGQGLGGLENIGHRDEHPRGNRALGFLLDLALLLNLQLLCHSDISLSLS